MTDTPPAAPTPATPATPPPAPASMAPAGPTQTKSIVGFILGIASIVLSGTGIIGVGLGIAAIILSNRGKKSEPGAPSWMHTVGVITGIVGIILSIILGIVFLVATILPLIYASQLGNTVY